MQEQDIFEELRIRPHSIHLYVPPIVWKGDSVGHIGKRDLFFFVVEGECFLHIDSQSFVVRPGQLAYLPRGRMRAYTHASERFSMYEMAFSAEADGENLMDLLGLSEDNFVVDVSERETVRALFESSYRREMYKDPIYSILWCENIMQIIMLYAKERQKTAGNEAAYFKPVLEYMAKNMQGCVRTEELSALVYMEHTYFTKKFRSVFGLPPMAYLNRMRMYTAMGLLVGTDKTVEQIGSSVGITDTSYFARAFKKHAGVTPTEYRSQFKKSGKYSKMY